MRNAAALSALVLGAAACASSDLCSQTGATFGSLADSGSPQCAGLTAVGFSESQCETKQGACTLADRGAVSAFLTCVDGAAATGTGCQASVVVDCYDEQLQDAGTACQAAFVGAASE